jgi:hypothetical protein
MTGEHPWREWAEVVGILAVGVAVVVAVVRLIVKWANDGRPPKQ